VISTSWRDGAGSPEVWLCAEDDRDTMLVLELNLNQPWQDIDLALRALVGVLAEEAPAPPATAAVG
jgi:hypothetical protein